MELCVGRVVMFPQERGDFVVVLAAVPDVAGHVSAALGVRSRPQGGGRTTH